MTIPLIFPPMLAPGKETEARKTVTPDNYFIISYHSAVLGQGTVPSGDQECAELGVQRGGIPGEGWAGRLGCRTGWIR